MTKDQTSRYKIHKQSKNDVNIKKKKQPYWTIDYNISMIYPMGDTVVLYLFFC